MFSGKANYSLRRVRIPEFELKLTYLELKHIPTNYSIPQRQSIHVVFTTNFTFFT